MEVTTVEADIKDCITQALRLTNEADLPEGYRLETFKILLGRLLDQKVGAFQSIRTPVAAKKPIERKDGHYTQMEGVQQDFPTIVPGKSTPENILLLLSTEWGNTPRSSKEIGKALAFNGVPDSKNVSTHLKRLFEKRILLCRMEAGDAVYWKNPNPPN